MTVRTSCLHAAHVYLAEARRRRHQPSFHATLLRWVANQRRQAAACVEAQGCLFA